MNVSRAQGIRLKLLKFLSKQVWKAYQCVAKPLPYVSNIMQDIVSHVLPFFNLCLQVSFRVLLSLPSVALSRLHPSLSLGGPVWDNLVSQETEADAWRGLGDMDHRVQSHLEDVASAWKELRSQGMTDSRAEEEVTNARPVLYVQQTEASGKGGRRRGYKTPPKALD